MFGCRGLKSGRALLRSLSSAMENGILSKDNDNGNKVDANAFNGTRKLIRPQLPQGERRQAVHTEDPLTHAMSADARAPQESSHAEAFYFQKQVQQQTEMTVVMEDGEEYRGVIEWYDKCVVKIRSGRRRIMIYKSGIKYLYKSSEATQGNSIMK